MCNDMDGARVYYTKRNKSVRERQLPYDFTPMWHLRNKTNQHTKKKETKKTASNTENKLVVARG